MLLGLRLIESAHGPPSAESGDDTGRVAELREIVADGLRRTRQTAFDLRPTVLDDVGLAPALQRLVADVAARSTLAIDAAVDGVPDRDGVAPEVATVVYRVVQEALTNILRHADASRASVTATLSKGQLRAIVEDDGVGFDVEAAMRKRNSFGLVGMMERVFDLACRSA